MTYDAYSVFGSEIRVKLILCLSHGQKNVSELISNCKLSQSAVSQHLAVLKAVGVVKTLKEGKYVYYQLRHRKAADICRLILEFTKESI